jgi:hypothetical protein
VDRNDLAWTLVVFFGASLLFAAIHRTTKGEGAAVSVGLQALAGLLLIGAIVLYMRRRR